VKRYKLILTFCLATLLAISAIATPKVNAAHEGGPHVRFAHFAATLGAVDIYVNGKQTVKDLKYKGVTDYLSLTGGSFDFVFVAAGGKVEDSLTPKPITIAFAGDEGSHFTLAALGSVKDNIFELLKLPADKGTVETPESSGHDSDHGHATPAATTVATMAATAAAGNITITGAYVRATALNTAHGDENHQTAAKEAPIEAVSGAYMTIKNTSSKADRLTTVTADLAGAVEIHETVITDGLAQMKLLDGIDIPANGVLELKPGSFHIMLMQLKHDLVPGQKVKLTLAFQSGISVSVAAPVQAP
jgi:periplasmic copper chaperone A